MMIYEYPDIAQPIRQGDIFVSLPRVEISLRQIPVIDDHDQTSEISWREIAQSGKPVTAVLALQPVVAIVATQDCDTVHDRDITLCEVRLFRDVERKAAQTESPKSWRNIITQHSRINSKWFYLPPDKRIGFSDKMAVDFLVTLRVTRAELEELRDLRRGRLNEVADEHFRERIAEFFRRYPYDEWYPLNQDEFQTYVSEYPGTEPFPWQRAETGNAAGQR